MAPHPGTGIDTDSIKGKARKELLNLLEAVRGKKNLVIEKALAGPIGLFIKFSTLQEYGVDKIFFLENNNVDATQKNVIFIIRGEDASQSLAVAEQIKRLQQSRAIDHEFSTIMIPRRTLVTKKILEDAGVLGDVSVEELPLYFLPLEHDVLSLELADSFRDLYLHKDPTCLFLAARAIIAIQQQYGLFPHIIGKGGNAQRMMELLLRMRFEASAEESSSSSHIGMMTSPSVESLIIIDREIDFVTPLLTQLTYEGLIDELFTIKDNQTEVDISVVGSAPGQPPCQTGLGKDLANPAQQSMKRKIQLDSSDKLYDQLRDTNFATVGPLLNKVARRLESDYESRHIAKSTSELREFVNKLPGYQAEQLSLKTHTSLAEEIMKQTFGSEIFTKILEVQQNLAAGSDPSTQHENLEELIARGTPLPAILRLLCLESCVSGGIRSKDLEMFKSFILHAYGYQHLLTLSHLEKMGLLLPRTSGNVLASLPQAAINVGGSSAVQVPQRTNYSAVRKALHLIVDEVNEANPTDIAYVYSGYAPLSVRLVQAIVQKSYLHSLSQKPSSTPSANPNSSSAAHGWQGFDEALRNVKGETFNKVQKGDEAASKARAVLSGTGGRKTVVVMFLGGITHAEIAALRFLGREEGGKNILVCTTGLLSGKTMMEAAAQGGGFVDS